jgi:subtilisin-like proprotein convertase family protein
VVTLPAGAPGTTVGDASPYPSTVSVAGHGGLITDVNVKLENIGHEHPDDLDILLVSPRGDSVELMSDACGSTDFEDFDWTFDDQAATEMPDSPAGACVSFFYKPSAYDGASDTWPVSFPGPHGTSLSDFNGENANGTWRLYARDDAAGQVGDIELGWSVTITTGPFTALLPGSGTAGPSDPYPLTHTVTGNEGITTDVNVDATGISHSHPDDLDVLVVGPNGAKVMLMSDSCGSFDVTNYHWRWDDEAPAAMEDTGSTNVCNAINHKPTNHDTPDALPAPAPAEPYGTSLTAFDSIEPNGEWKLYVVDDAGGDSGFLSNPFTIELTTRPKGKVSFNAASVSPTLAEGATHQLTIVRSGVPGLLAGSVTVTSASGTAQQGSDFTAINQVVAFGAGQTEKTIPVTIAADGAEVAEKFTVTINSGSGDAVPAAPLTSTVTIPGDLVANPDKTAPDTKIDKAPPKKTRKKKAKVQFSSTEAGSTFKCKLDKGAFAPCSSPLTLKKLKVGRHTLQVVAVDAAGNADASPATAQWKVQKKRKKGGRH